MPMNQHCSFNWTGYKFCYYLRHQEHASQIRGRRASLPCQNLLSHSTTRGESPRIVEISQSRCFVSSIICLSACFRYQVRRQLVYRILKLLFTLSLCSCLSLRYIPFEFWLLLVCLEYLWHLCHEVSAWKRLLQADAIPHCLESQSVQLQLLHERLSDSSCNDCLRRCPLYIDS